MSPRLLASASLLLCVLLLIVPRDASAQSATEVVIEWNRILQVAAAVPRRAATDDLLRATLRRGAGGGLRRAELDRSPLIPADAWLRVRIPD